jgi:hypothetical protein
MMNFIRKIKYINKEYSKITGLIKGFGGTPMSRFSHFKWKWGELKGKQIQ